MKKRRKGFIYEDLSIVTAVVLKICIEMWTDVVVKRFVTFFTPHCGWVQTASKSGLAARRATRLRTTNLSEIISVPKSSAMKKSDLMSQEAAGRL
jgi:hypothetical protein